MSESSPAIPTNDNAFRRILRSLFGETVAGTGYLACCMACRHLFPVDPETPHFDQYGACRNLSAKIHVPRWHGKTTYYQTWHRQQRKAEKTMSTPKTIGRAVIVTTAHRGVFFGYTDNTDGDVIALKQARLCVYWTADLRGFMGLASSGPGRGCKIGPPADITLRAITAVVEVSDEAAARWESAPWNG